MRLRHRLSFLLLSIVFFAITANCAEPGLAGKSAQVDEILAPQFKENGPGAAVLVIQDGEKVYEKCFGIAAMKTMTPIRPHTVFELASCSKQFTAMAIMILADQNKLRYSDHLTKFFPEFQGFGDGITVEHLLHHTGGLTDYMDAWSKAGEKGEPTSREMIHLLSRVKKVEFQPGQKYEYSNSGYMVLAQIVEKASGKKYPEFVKEHIFKRIGMNESLVFDETRPQIEHPAHSFEFKGGEWKNIDRDPLNFIYGDGAVKTNLDDLYKWDQALYTEKLVSHETLEKAFTEGKLNDGSGTGYGFGWGVSRAHGSKCLDHEGAWLGFRTEIYRLPEHHFSVIMLGNFASFHPGPLVGKIAAIYFSPKK